VNPFTIRSCVSASTATGWRYVRPRTSWTCRSTSRTAAGTGPGDAGVSFGAGGRTHRRAMAAAADSPSDGNVVEGAADGEADAVAGGTGPEEVVVEVAGPGDPPAVQAEAASRSVTAPRRARLIRRRAAGVGRA